MARFNLYIDGEKVEREVSWETIKTERLSNLLQTDKYMILDYPISQQQKEELILFRQLLRDLPETYELTSDANENYPVMPLFVREG
tara:strand:- start:456 stop:713 length:258 start_codon:yes stop_codon:yes gene_type:complete